MFKPSNWIKRAVFVALAAGSLFAIAYPAGAASAPSLGSAQSFAVLGGTTVTNTGTTTIGGDLGVSPGSAVANTGSFTFLNAGTQVTDPAVTLQAQNDVLAANTALTSKGCTAPTNTALTGTLTPGVYCYSSSASLTGTVTLDAQGNAGAVFIFKAVSTLTTATGSTVALANGAQPCNVFWQIGSSADLFANTTFVGNILAYASINLQSGAYVSGRALAQTGAVTMDSANVSRPKTCAAGTTPTATPTATSPGATPTAPAPTATPTAPLVGVTATPGVTGTPGATATASTPGATPTGPTATPTTPPVPGLPNAGGFPPLGGGSPWLLVLVATVVGGLAVHSSVRAHQGRAQRTTKHRLL
jgi:hypothetical protein